MILNNQIALPETKRRHKAELGSNYVEIYLDQPGDLLDPRHCARLAAY